MLCQGANLTGSDFMDWPIYTVFHDKNSLSIG